MRKYTDYSNDILGGELYDGLLGFGLFAEKIPSFLTSEAFLNYTKALKFPISKTPKDYIRYSNIRNINIPRPFAIPEPFAYANQCKSLSDNWTEIKKHFEEKTLHDEFKVSRIHLRKLKNKFHLFEMNYKNFSTDGDPTQDIVIKSNFIANADISNCFPSIYSHSIVWSLIGKEFAKKDKKSNKWYNDLDLFTRNLKHGETNGVLIGPHSSNLISEIILVNIDFELSKQGFKYVRNIDDYDCYVDSFELADKFFMCLSEELKKYELSLNSKKSKIIPLPQASVKNWVAKLNHFNFTRTYIVNGVEAIRVKELKGFLDFAIELMLDENSDATVINYAIKILSKKHLDRNAKDYYVKQIHHLVLKYPYLTNLLELDVFEIHNIDKQKIQEIAVDVYVYGIKKKIYEACSYAVYWLLKYDIIIDEINFKNDSIGSADCIFMTISFLYDKRHRSAIYLKEYFINAEQLNITDFDRYWLFVYEVLPWSKLKNDYKPMKKEGLTFIKSQFL